MVVFNDLGSAEVYRAAEHRKSWNTADGCLKTTKGLSLRCRNSQLKERAGSSSFLTICASHRSCVRTPEGVSFGQKATVIVREDELFLSQSIEG